MSDKCLCCDVDFREIYANPSSKDGIKDICSNCYLDVKQAAFFGFGGSQAAREHYVSSGFGYERINGLLSSAILLVRTMRMGNQDKTKKGEK